jgi:predicted aspartyl protease
MGMLRLRFGWLRIASALVLTLATAARSPQAADAPPDQIPPIIHFKFYFDRSKMGPQPIIGADKGPLLVTEVEVNGHWLPAVLDTGTELSTIDSSVAKDIGLKIGKASDIGTMGGAAQVSVAYVDEIAAGGFVRRGGWISVSDLSAVDGVFAQHFSMLLGAEFLAQVALEVDRDKETVTFLPSGTHLSGVWTKVPLHLRQPGNHYYVRVSVNGRPLDVRVDTGGDDELRLGESQWAHVVPASARTTDLAAVALGGMYVEPIARVQGAAIGGVPIGDVITTNPATGLDSKSDGALGMGILSRFNLLLDPHHRVFAIAKPQKPRPPRVETLTGIQGPLTDDGLNVVHVMAKSPAAAAGLKDGDKICTVDGIQIRLAKRWEDGPAGKTVILGRCGGGTVSLTLRQFY